MLVKTALLIVPLPRHSKLLLIHWVMFDSFLNFQPGTPCKIIPPQLFLSKFQLCLFDLCFPELTASQISFFHFSFWYHFLPTPLKLVFLSSGFFLLVIDSLYSQPPPLLGPSLMWTNGYYSSSSTQTAFGMLLHQHSPTSFSISR